MNPSQDPILTEIKARLTAALDIKKIYLFGSRARGNACEGSDYDILVVVADTNKFGEGRKVSARDALSDIRTSIDVFVYTESEFNEWKNELSSLPEAALHEGVEL